MLSSYSVSLWNPTPYERTEYVVFGTPDQAKDSFWSVSGNGSHYGFLNVKEFNIPANFLGVCSVSAEPYDPCTPPEQFKFHDQVRYLFALGLYPYLEYTDQYNVKQKAYFELKKEDDERISDFDPVVKHPRILVQRYCVRVGNSRRGQLIGELTWTFFTRTRKSKIELRVISESKNRYIDIVNNVTFGFDGLGKDHIDYWFHFADKTNLIPGKYIADSQGVKVFGECWFLHSNYTAAELQTYNASKAWPLYALYDWTTTGWGFFNVTPSALSSTLSSTLWNQRRRGYNWFDRYEHKGRILNKRPADTGEQAEFGAWTHLETVGNNDVRNALFDQLTVAQETLRDGNYFEPNSFKFVDTSGRQNFIIWDGKVRVSNTGFGYDVLGRTYTSNGGDFTYPDTNEAGTRGGSHKPTEILGWNGHDAGHYGGMKSLVSDFLLYGQFSTYFQLKQKVTHLKAYLPTSASITNHRFTYMPGGWGEHQIEPREFGRPLFEAMVAYKALGDEELLDRACRKITEEIFWKWPGRFNTYWQGCGRYSSDSAYFGGNTPFWWTWQDALLLQGFYAVYEILDVHPDRTSNATLSSCYEYVQTMMSGVGEAFVVYGCRPANRANPNYPAINMAPWPSNYETDYGADTDYHPLQSAFESLSEPRKANQNAKFPIHPSSLPFFTELPPFGPSGDAAYDTDDLDTTAFNWAYNTDYGPWSMGLFSMVAANHANVPIAARSYELFNFWRDASIISGGKLISAATMNYAGYPQPIDPESP